jgi:hypothetical protein
MINKIRRALARFFWPNGFEKDNFWIQIWISDPERKTQVTILNVPVRFAYLNQQLMGMIELPLKTKELRIMRIEFHNPRRMANDDSYL